MYTSIIVLALVGAPGDVSAPSWQSYSQASQMVLTEKKPMAVFLGAGQKGWEQVAGSLGSEAEKVLAASYICTYVDTSTPAGEKLAQAFALKNGIGVVLSDRKGEVQVYWHEGNLPQPDLVRQLVRHSTSTRVSMYGENSVTGTTSAIMSSGAYCPTCSGTTSVIRRR